MGQVSIEESIKVIKNFGFVNEKYTNCVQTMLILG